MWLPGVVIGLLLAVLVRPLLVYPLLRPAGLAPGENAFVLFAGLKGAVPLLLGSMLLPLAGGARLYGVVVVVVLGSVVVQGSLVPTVARLLEVGMRVVEPEPFVSGMRLREEPLDERHLTVAAGSVAAGRRIDALPGLAEGTRVSMLRRDGSLVPVRGATRVLAGDEVLLLVDPEQDCEPVVPLFTGSGQPA